MSQDDCPSCPSGISCFREFGKGKPVEKVPVCNASVVVGCGPQTDCAKCPHLSELKIVDLQKKEPLA